MKEDRQYKEKDKIEYYKDLIDSKDSELLSLINERLAATEEFSEYMLKHGMEGNTMFRNILLSDRVDAHEKDLGNLVNEFNKITKNRYRKVSEKFNGKYAYLGKNVPKLMAYTFQEFLGKEVGSFLLENDEIASLLSRDNFYGYFIANRYKKSIGGFLDGMTDQAAEIGQVNLVQKYKGKNFGFNTEFIGLMKLIKKFAIDINGKDITVLSKDGEDLLISYTLDQLHARSVSVMSLEDLRNFQMIDSQILINTIMFENQESYEDFSCNKFTDLEWVIDLASQDIYSRLIIDCRDRNIRGVNGLYKEIFQYKKSLEILFRKKFDDEYFEDILHDYFSENLNIVLVGMPGAGKTTVGRKLGKLLNRKHYDLDREFYFEYGIAPQEYLRKFDEETFREKERLVVEKLGKYKGAVISTSGGVVSKIENYYDLKKNSVIFMVERDLSNLSTKNRPLSEGGIETLIKMKKSRQENYEYFTDYTVENKGDFNGVAYKIRDIFNQITID